MKTLLICLAMLFASAAHAQTPLEVDLSWQAPTAYTDGTPIEAGDISGYTLLCGTVQGTDSITGAVAATATSVTRDQLLTSYAMKLDTAYFCSLTVTTDNGQTSERSSEVHFVMESPPAPRVPKAPVLTVN